MKIYQYRPVILALMLAAALMAGMPSWALAQCGGSGSGSGYTGSTHDQHMGYSGQGMYGRQAPVQTDPNAVTPGYAAPAPPASGYANPQNPGGSGPGQMMNQGSAGSGHSGHMGNN